MPITWKKSGKPCEEMESEGWTEKQTTDARYWLDVVVIEEVATA